MPPNLSDLCLCSLNIFFSSIFLIQFLLKCASMAVENVIKSLTDAGRGGGGVKGTDRERTVDSGLWSGEWALKKKEIGLV